MHATTLDIAPLMKFLPLSLFASLLTAASLASGSTNFSYTASNDPNANPDSNSNTVDAWTLSRQGDTAGYSTTYSGSYYSGASGMLTSAWAIYCTNLYTPTTPGSYTTEVDQNATFLGGALNVGQTMSIDFLASAVASGQQYGIRMLTGGTFDLALSFVGGDSGYRYYDKNTSGSSPFGYQGNGFHFAYTQTSATTYTVVATPIGGGAVIGTFSGTDGSASPNQIQIYNLSAGNNNNVLTNNFAVVPEPGPLAFLVGGGLGLFVMRARRRSARSVA